MNRRGVATVMVIVIIGLLAVVLTTVAARVTATSRRAAIEADDAQASRLLAAAKELARAQLAGTPADGPVPTPVGSVTLAWRGEGARRDCTAVVQAGGVRREVVMTFDNGRVTQVYGAK